MTTPLCRCRPCRPTVVTHTRGHALFLSAPRVTRLARCVCATEKQHPTSFSVLVAPSSSNARGAALSLCLSLTLASSLSLSLFRRGRRNELKNEKNEEKTENQNRHRTDNARHGVTRHASLYEHVIVFLSFFFLNETTVRCYETTRCAAVHMRTCSVCFTHETPVSLSRRVSGR